MFLRHVARLARDEEAVVAAEYAVMLSLISMVCVMASTELGRWLSETMENVAQAGLFKRLPTHKQHFAPQSEYFFKNIQPAIDDSLYLGREYEDQFDRFEVLYALITADLYVQEGRKAWGPPGRFGWKFSRDRDENSSFTAVVREATQLEENWPPLRAGFFGGSFERFADIAEKYKALLGTLGWY